MKRYKFRWWHVHATAGLVILGLLLAFIFGAFAAANYKTLFGVKLDKQGQQLYKQVAAKHVEKGQKKQTAKLNGEVLPPAEVAKLQVLADAAATAKTAGPPHPVPLATPEPISMVLLTSNYSSRYGHHPALLMVHSTESPNVPGTADVRSVATWFANTASQASSNYVIDCEGNVALVVRDTNKAWTQAFFNPWSISIEFIGRASQTSWCEGELRAGAKVFAGEAAKWGIPVQLGAAHGCSIDRAGILEHLHLGPCGGGHHDAGPNFPLQRFIALVKQYRDGGFHPKKPIKLTNKQIRVKLRAWILLERHKGVSWAVIRKTSQYRQFISTGGH